MGGHIYYAALPFFEARALLEKKIPLVNARIISDDGYDLMSLRALLASQSLFDAQTIVFNNILTKDRLVELKPLFQTTAQTVLVCESSDAAWKQSAIEALGGTVISVPAKKAVAKPYTKTYAFDVGSAILDKNKKAAWLTYHKALANDEVPEMIHNAVWWTIKQLALASPSPRLAKYKKTYDPASVANLALWWIGLLHKSRKGNRDLSLMLEKAILEM